MLEKLGVLARACFVCSVAVASCGGDEKPAMVPIDAHRGQPPTADVAELEIRASGIDRFATCPPPGELGQQWIPPLQPWTPAAPSADAGAPEPIDQELVTRTKDRTNTEQAVEATLREFRSCYRRGLVRDPIQAGRVAIVLRIGANGRVEKVEEYAACELAPEAIACMKGVASRLRFLPPPNGSDTVTIPAVFTSRDGISRASATANDAYTARAYVTIETGRPAFHACEEQARKELRPVQATGTFTLTLAPDGRVVRAHVDPWSGEQSLLMCAAKALETLKCAPPPAGNGTVIARLNFNPRQGTR
jgi:hypothetical protein